MGNATSWRRGLAGAVTLMLMACAGGPPPPTVVELTLAATADANLIDNQPRPVLVRIYQLKSKEAFELADFGELEAKLGDNLLGQDEFPLMPGASQDVTLEIDPDARYLGMVAEFYQMFSGATWRDTVAIPPNKTTVVTATVASLTVAFE